MNNRKSLQILPQFVLRILALVTMTIDHTGVFLQAMPEPYRTVGYVFRCIGRIAFPLFVFFLAEGARRTHNPLKYFLRVFALYAAMILAETIYIYAYPGAIYSADTLAENPFTDLALVLGTLLLLRQKGWKKILAILPASILILGFSVDVYEKANAFTIHWFPFYLRPGYSLIGLLLGLGFYFAAPLTDKITAAYAGSIGLDKESIKETPYYQRLKNLLCCFVLFVVIAGFWGLSYVGYTYDRRPLDVFGMSVQSYALLAMPLLYLYSGKRGHDSKPFRIISYLFFPVHLIILFLIFAI